MASGCSRVIGWTAIVLGVALAVGFQFLPDAPLSGRLIATAVALVLFVGMGLVVLGGTVPPCAESDQGPGGIPRTMRCDVASVPERSGGAGAHPERVEGPPDALAYR